MRSSVRPMGLIGLPLLLALACGDTDPASSDGASTSDTGITGDGDPSGDGDPGTTGGSGGGNGDGDGDSTGDGDPTGDGDSTGECVVTDCAGKVYQCGNCEDDDDDGHVDASDANCWGPCDNNEAGFKGNIPGQAHAPCTSLDCYFDDDSGAGNDECYWSHGCDPSEPNPSGCAYDENTSLPGSGGLSCESAQQMQSEICEQICEPLVPNGCDCFGCCAITQGNETYTVYLGTEDAEGNGSCSLDVVDDPEKCAPCIQVEACLNPCEADPENCEICIGETVVPDDCDEAGCPDGIQSCDPNNNSADCPTGMFCVTGCCYPSPG